jgi:hypothetical protein
MLRNSSREARSSDEHFRGCHVRQKSTTWATPAKLNLLRCLLADLASQLAYQRARGQSEPPWC